MPKHNKHNKHNNTITNPHQPRSITILYYVKEIWCSLQIENVTSLLTPSIIYEASKSIILLSF